MNRINLAAFHRPLILLVLTLQASPAAAANGVISRKLDVLARDLAGSFAQKHPDSATPTLAIFSFNSNPVLSRAKIGYAIAELLTHKFVESGRFRVVERAQLGAILEEQRLSLTGAIDVQSAAAIGKLAGARVLLLGSVERLGDSYQVNARLVDAESGEVVATGFQELPGELFEESARPYLAHPPDRQAIGLYLLYNFRHNANEQARSQIQHPFQGSLNTAPRSFATGLLGGGVRYQPFESWMFDASFAMLMHEVVYANHATFLPNGTRKIAAGKMSVFRASWNWLRRARDGASVFAGLGFARYQASPDDADFPAAVVPALRAGGEIRLQPRLGLGLAFNYDFLNKAGTDYFSPHPAVIGFARWSLEPTLALYF